MSVLITGYALLLVGLMAFYQGRPRKRYTLEFRDLLDRLFPIPPEGATLFIAGSELSEAGKSLDCDQLWRAVGRHAGLWQMMQNANVVLLLAALIQLREPNVELFLVKQLRADAALLRYTVYQLRFLMLFHITLPSMASLLNRAGATYWLMIRRVLELYELHHACHTIALKNAFNMMSQHPEPAVCIVAEVSRCNGLTQP